MANGLFDNVYNPDVLSCLANLSNDEVFTPPEIVNQMLDMLPQELFINPDTTFLDPACKTGVFLREIAKRVIDGLEPQFPDLQERLDHIYHKQLFGIAITELTSLLSRRGLYCSKYPNGEFSVSHFEDAQGNIRFKNIQHTWVNGRCKFCGASKNTVLGSDERGVTLESHAYEWIHTLKPEDIWNMKFDVILSNPPYQLSTGGSGVQATPIYNKFIQQAKALKPRYLSMIVPARWFSGGFGLDSFRDEMLHDRSLREIHDYPEANDCFSGVQIKGGVCYFLWDRDHQGDCTVYTHRGNNISDPETRPLLEKGCDTFIRYNEAVDILHKMWAVDGDKLTMDTLVSSQKPFGLGTKFKGEYSTPGENRVKVYGSTGTAFTLKRNIEKMWNLIDAHKVFISAAGSGSDTFPHQILGRPFYGEKNTACSETYVVIGPFRNKQECENVMSYISTKMFRFLVMLKKPTQHALKGVYSLVPVLDFSRSWTDEELYDRYHITEQEKSFIDSMIRPMDLGGDNNAD